jgi:Domain of unknown function (DUF4115)
VAFRRLPTSLRTVDRYHRALDTMGKLAAQQAAPPLDPAKSADHPRLTQPAEPDHSYVRVVRDETAPAAPPRPPTLRSRPRRPRPPAYPDAVTTPGPNTRIVKVDEPPLTSTPPPGSSPSQLEPGRIERSALGADAPDVTTPASETAPPRSRHAGSGEAEQGPVLNGQVEHGPVDHGPVDNQPVDNGTIRPSDAAGSKMLYFDAVDDLPMPSTLPGSITSWAEVAPTDPDSGSPAQSGSARSRSARSRSRSRGPTFRPSTRGARRYWAVAAAAAALLIVAAVVGFRLAGETGSHGRSPAPSPQATPTRPATPVASAPTAPTAVPTTPAPTAVLVGSSAGSSTYRVDASATISFRAINGVCWVEIRQSGPYGPVVFSGDLLTGQTRNMNGPVWARLGNPGVIAVTVNGASISPPGMAAGQPYDIQFA